MPQGANERNDASLLQAVLRWVTRHTSNRPKLTLSIVGCLACAAIGFTWSQIGFKTDRSDLIDPDAAFQQRWNRYTESFGDSSDIVVVVESDHADTIKQALDDLGERIEQEPELLSNVLYKLDPGSMRGKGLQRYTSAQLESGLNRLSQYSPILQGQWNLLRLESLVARLQYQIESRSTSSSSAQPLLHHADLLTSSMAGYLTNPNVFESPWPEILPAGRWLRAPPGEPIYFLNEHGTLGFLKVSPTQTTDDFSGGSQSVERLREIVDEVSRDYAFAKISLTGIPVLESDEMSRSQTDMTIASIVSIVGVGLLLFLGFRGYRHPVLALTMLIVGMAWTFGYTTIAVGHLNILSVSFAVILIGLGIDFAIHYLAKYLELRHEGESLQPALLRTSGSVGVGIVTATVTTSFAFFCATFTDFLGIAELGIIVGGGIVLCALATFLVLPALLTLADRNVEPKRLPSPFAGKTLRSATSQFPMLLLLASFAILLVVGAGTLQYENGQLTSRIRYDYNLLNLQADGLESVDVQKRIFDKSHDSLLYAVSVADSASEARALSEQFRQLPSVHHVVDLASRLPAYPIHQTRLLIQTYRARLAHLSLQPPRLPAPRPAELGRQLERFYLQIRDNSDPLSQKIAGTVNSFLNEFEQLPLEQQTIFVNDYHYRMVGDLYAQFRGLAAATNTSPLSMADMPVELTSRFISPEGKWLIQIYPNKEIWDVEPLSQFVDDVRSVDPDVTGTPLQNFEASRQIKQSYLTASWYALAVICLVLLIDFLGRDHKLVALLPPLIVVGFAAMIMHTRRVEINPVVLITVYVVMVAAIAALIDFPNLRDALLAMLPPLAGGLLMFGALGFLGIDLNPANLIVLPLVLGIGVDDGVHVIHDYRLQSPRKYRISASTMNAIVLTSLTSMIGFGSLMLASHRGLRSVGLVLVIGVGSCLFASLVTLPAILALLDRRRAKKSGISSRGESKPAQQQSKKPKAA